MWFSILLLLNAKILLIYGNVSMIPQVESEEEHSNSDPFILNIILDILRYEEKPTSLIAFKSCWKLGITRNLVTQVSKLGIFFSTSLPESHSISHEILLIFDLDCFNTSDVILEVNKKHMFQAPYRWIFLQDSRQRSIHGMKYSVLEKLDLLPDNDVLFLDRISDSSFDLSKMYKVNRSSSLIRQHWGSWSSGKLQVNNNFGLFRRDLQKTPIIMSNVVFESETTKEHLADAKEPEIDSITKRTYMLVSLAIEMMNGTRVTTFTPTWGYPDKHGNWSGMTDLLIQGEVNVGTATFMTSFRQPVIDYIAPSPGRVRFVFRRPTMSSVGDIYAMTFDSYVWSAGIMSVLAAAAVIYLCTKWEIYLSKEKKDATQMRSKDAYLIATSAMFQQGCSVEPQRISGRLATFALFLSMMTLYAGYSANIVVLLRATSSSIRTLEDLLNSRIAMATSDTIYNHYYFPHQTEPVRKAIYEKKIAPRGVKPRFLTIPEGVNRIREGMFAFNMEVDVGYRHVEKTFLEHEKCDLVEIDYLNMIDPYIPIEKNSPYREMFKIYLKHIHEAGLRTRLISLVVTPKPSCSSAHNFSSVSYIDFYPAIVWMTYGFALALLILLGEIIVDRRSKRAEVFIHRHLRTVIRDI